VGNGALVLQCSENLQTTKEGLRAHLHRVPRPEDCAITIARSEFIVNGLVSRGLALADGAILTKSRDTSD
jgi:hypothetical protein